MSDSAFRPQPGAWYTLEFRSFRSVEVSGIGLGATIPNGRIRVPGLSMDNVQLAVAAVPSTQAAEQSEQWSFEEVEPGWFIITSRYSGKVMDVRYASGAEGTVIQQLARHAPDSSNRFAQHFSVTAVGDRYVIRSRTSQKVLYAQPASSSSFLLTQSQYDGKAAEKLVLTRVEVRPFVPERNVDYRLRFRHSGKVLDVAESSTQDGANIYQWAQTQGTNQHWSFEEVEPGWYILHARHSDKVMDVSGGSVTSGANIFQWPRHGGQNQQWKIQVQGGDYVLINRKSGQAMTVSSKSTADGGDVIQQPLDTSAQAQLLEFEAVEKAFEPVPGVYYTLKFTHSGHSVAISAGSVADSAAAVQLKAAGQPFTEWRFEQAAPGFYVLIARHSDKVLGLQSEDSADGVRIVQQARADKTSQHWAILTGGNGMVLRNRFSGKVMDVSNVSQNEGAYLHQWTALGSGNQGLTAIASAKQDLKPRTDAWHVLRFAHSSKLLTVGQGRQEDGTPVWQALDNNGHHQQWRFTEIEPGWYLLTARHSGKALDLSNGSTSDGATIQQWTRQDTNKNQHFALVSTPYGWSLRARKSGKPIEIPGDSQEHGTLVKQGSPQWDQNQSLGIEVYVSDATLNTPVNSYTKPSLPAPAVGVATSGEATGGTPTAAATTSTTVPSAVTANSPVSASVFFVPYSVPISFSGSVSSQSLSSGESFEGPGQLPAPFSTAVDSLKLLVSSGASAGKALRFKLPSTRSLKAIIEDEIVGKISDSSVRSVVSSTLKPFAALMQTPTVMLSTNVGKDASLGSYMEGFNAFATVSIASIPPFNLLHSMFPSAGLNTRSLTLGIGTSNAINPSEIEFWVSGSASLNLPLIPSFLTLADLSLKLGKTISAVNTAGELTLKLKVPGEELTLRGGIETSAAAGATQSTVWAALDADDGMWKNAFGIPGLDVAGMGLQVTSGMGIGVRGELHLGSGLLGARVGILIDPASPQTSILDIYSEEGLQLPRLLQPLLGSALDVGTVCDVGLTELQLYVAPTGGSIAGQDYARGVTVGGKLHLWGWDAMAKGTVSTSALDLQAQADPLHLKAGDVSFFDLSSATDPNKGPSFRFTLSSSKFGGSISAAVSLLGGAIKGSLQGTVNAKGFSGTLQTGAGGGGLGIYAGTTISLDQGLFRLAFSPTIKVAVSLGGYRTELSVACTIATEISASRFKQSIAFAFSAMGTTYRPGPFSVSVPFRDLDDLIEAFYHYAADLLANQLTGAVREATNAAVSWVKTNVTSIIDDAGQLFKQVGADANRVANGFKDGWGAGANEVARVMRSSYGWTVEQTGTFLRDVYGLGAEAIASALNGAGYAADSVKDLFDDWGGEFEDWIEDNLDPTNWDWPW